MFFLSLPKCRTPTFATCQKFNEAALEAALETASREVAQCEHFVSNAASMGEEGEEGGDHSLGGGALPLGAEREGERERRPHPLRRREAPPPRGGREHPPLVEYVGGLSDLSGAGKSHCTPPFFSPATLFILSCKSPTF